MERTAKLTVMCIVLSGLEKLVTYCGMRIFPEYIGESNPLVLHVLEMFGLEFAVLIYFVISVMGLAAIKKIVNVYPRIEKFAITFFIIVAITYSYVLACNLYDLFRATVVTVLATVFTEVSA